MVLKTEISISKVPTARLPPHVDAQVLIRALVFFTARNNCSVGKVLLAALNQAANLVSCLTDWKIELKWFNLGKVTASAPWRVM